MNRRMIVPLLFGIFGTALFIALGTWQWQRLEWKTDLLAEIDARLMAEPVPVPFDANPENNKYLQVAISGTYEPKELHVLTFGGGFPGYRVISPLVLSDGRRVLADRGIIGEPYKDDARNGGAVVATGALVWPDETDNYTPEPNLERNIWFAREVIAMADTLKTEPIMIAVQSSDNNEGIKPQRVAVNIPNNHLEYVLTWYGFAVIWIVMTTYLLWRIRNKTA